MENELLYGIGIFIPVSDLTVSTKWYETMLGFKILHHDEPNANVLQMGNGTVVFCLVKSYDIKQPQFPKNDYNVNQYFNFHTRDIDAIYKQLLNKGANVTAIHEFDGMRGFSLFDPDHNLFGVVQ